WTVDKLEVQLTTEDAKAAQKTLEGAAVGGPMHVLLVQHREHPVAGALKAKHPKDHEALVDAFHKLHELANAPGMARTMRRMLEPTEVTASRRSKSGTGTTNCDPIDNRKYLFPLKELKESSRFSIVAHDYWTPWRDITLVPPPMIDSLGGDREEPAYLHYRLLADPMLLKNKRQLISATAISTTGPKSDIDVPFGTHVAITAHVDRPLKKEKDVRVAAPEKRLEINSITPPVEVHLEGDAKTFRVEFKNVQKI